MKKSHKKSLITAGIITFLGIALFFVGFMMLDYNMEALDLRGIQKKTYKVSGNFSGIKIGTTTSDVLIYKTKYKRCIVNCMEENSMKYSVKVENRVLKIEEIEDKAWYEYLGIPISKKKLFVLLPARQYDSLSINVNTGDVRIPRRFRFKKLVIYGDTSNIDSKAKIYDEMNIHTASGDVTVTSRQKVKDIRINTKAGNVFLEDFKAKKLVAETGSGIVRFNNFDAGYIRVKTGSGNVYGTFDGGRNFNVKSQKGIVDVPKNRGKKIVKIKTYAGSVKFGINR